MPDGPTIIVIANSARALAAAAKRAGYAPLAMDVFGDCDTRELSLAAVTLEGGLSDGLTPDKVICAVERLVHAYKPIGLIYGSGFEHQPETIGSLGRLTRILGNDAKTLARTKDPFQFAQLCVAVGVSHPSIASTSPDEPESWLVKKRGGAGGAHIHQAQRQIPVGPDGYFQRRVTGQNISALFVADGKTAGIIGLSVQWTSPTPASAFRYGGAAGPIDVEAAEAEKIAYAVQRLTWELSLVGLNSADFLVSADAVWLIEINPRPGATLDVFESTAPPLFAYHVAGCEGREMMLPSRSACKAAEVVYAPHNIVLPTEPRWPDWTADRPAPGTRVAAGDPLCTALASGATVEWARARANARAQNIIALFGESNP